MIHDLLAALALVAVLEGLMLFAAPQALKRMVEQLAAMPPRQLRIIGAIFVAVGLVSLQVLRG